MPAYVPQGAHARRTLIKDTTGTCRPSSYDLPSSDNVYGKKATSDGEGTAELISALSVHQPSKPAVSDQDVVKCNRMAVRNKLITAKDQYDFQLAHQHVKKSHARSSMFEKDPIPSNGPFGVASYPRLPDGSIKFGPPDGTIEKVINNEYANKSTGSESYPDISGRVIPGKMPPPKDTNSNRLKTHKGDPEVKEPFVMKKFQNVKPRVQSRF